MLHPDKTAHFLDNEHFGGSFCQTHRRVLRLRGITMKTWPARLTALAGGVALATLSLAAGTSLASTPAKPGGVRNPYSPAYHASYRHGVVPTVGQQRKMNAYAASHRSSTTTTATGPETLAYGGGIDGIGVTSGTPRVYLVFWGTQWGTQSTDSSGNLTFSNDPDLGAPYLQKLFKGLGTGNELWSGTMTQYCDGSSVATGATSCPSGAPHIGYPTGGALAGVWYDNSAAEPSAASGHQLGQEAVNAAAHFGNTTAATNRYAQYVILSPTGLNPDNYKTQGFCAWHDYNGDSTLSGGAVSSPYGDIAFTNMPYVMDMGASCGQNFVNASGTLDGYSIVEGHEYAETVTDQNPAGGWTNQQANTYSGQENGDECAWISSGQGASSDVSMGTGVFAMQSTWSNDTNECDISHAIVGGTVTNDFSISVSPSSGSVTAGQATTATVSTTITSGSAQTVSLSATGLPAGATASYNPTSVTSGGSSTLTLSTASSTPAGTYTITVTGTGTSATHSTAYTLTVSTSGTGGGITNGGFETGNFTGWTVSGAAESVVSSLVHSGTYADQGGSTSPTNGDSSAAQTFTVPSGFNTLSFWYDVVCPDTLTYDWATATLRDNTSGTTTTPLAKTCVSNSGWLKITSTVTAGHSYTLTLTSHDDNYASDPTYTHFDDVALSSSVTGPNVVTNGGFETGNLSGWTATGTESVSSSLVHSGTYADQGGSSSPTNGDSSASQTFTAGTGDSTLTFWYDVVCPDTVTYDWATATLRDNATGVTTTVLGKTCVGNSGWVKRTASITPGHSYTLTMTSHDDNYPGDPTYTHFDDVSTS
jgi:serine protease